MSSSVLPSVLTSPSAPSGRIALATVAGLVVGGGLTLLLQRVFDDYYCGGGEATAAVENRRSRHRRRHQRPTAAITQGHDEDIRDIVERIVSLQDEVKILTSNISTLVKNQKDKYKSEIDDEEDIFLDPLDSDEVVSQHAGLLQQQPAQRVSQSTIGGEPLLSEAAIEQSASVQRILSEHRQVPQDLKSSTESVLGNNSDISKEDSKMRNSITLSFYDMIDSLFQGTDKDRTLAYKKLVVAEKNRKEDVSFLWRISRSCFQESVIAKLNDKPEKCKQLIIRAKDHAFAALKLDETDCQVHKWCAITIGSVGDFETTSIRIKNGFKFKEHIDEAIRLCPKDAEAHHLQGRWCYEVAQLSWIERKAAATLFANPPTATVAEALRCFVKSETLKPNEDICNQLYLGKCYIYKAEYKNSVEWLKKAQNIASKGLEDNSYKEQVDKLLYKYESYA